MNLEVQRSELNRIRVDGSDADQLQADQARIRIDHFALSTNNITYAVYGEAMRYWDFFPAGPPEDADGAPWGRIPVWAFGEVVETNSPDVAIGERLFGYFPMGSELVITVGRADSYSVFDVAPHRAEMASAYSSYVRSASDPIYRADREDAQMLLYPLFFTSFLVDDYLVDNEGFGSDTVIVSSASSKTSIGVAYLGHRRGARVIGLTSTANVAFVESLGVYDEVCTYDAIDQLVVSPAVYVDVAGNRDVLGAVHRRFGQELAHSMMVGGTHWDHQAEPVTDDLPGPTPAFFFAPSQISKRNKDWGREELNDRLSQAWVGYLEWTDGWIAFQHAQGTDAVSAVYLELLGGRPDPRAGYICSLVTSEQSAS
ncbi:MAG: DUF2855 family protein [Actinomycetes bacterium]